MPSSDRVQDSAISLKKAFAELTKLRTKITNVFKEIDEVKRRLAELGRDIHELKDVFGTEGSWGALAKKLIETGKKVEVHFTNGDRLKGQVLWTDRYNIGFRLENEHEGMLLKGGLTYLFPVKD